MQTDSAKFLKRLNLFRIERHLISTKRDLRSRRGKMSCEVAIVEGWSLRVRNNRTRCAGLFSRC